MKQIDKLLISSFIGPFIVTFCIALFVLIMQTLWLYIDDIIGKGVGILMITELIFYLSISLFPMALPIAVLISSVMVMGNLAEHYELASFKSAGVPLVRMMMPMAFMAFLIGCFSFLCSNTLIPISNLQFKSRLYDIRKQKPTLSLEEQVFNDDFQGFTIYIGNKHEDGQTIENILIYDNNYTEARMSQITAERGKMYTTEDQRYFIMTLFDGTRNEEVGSQWENGKRNYSFSRTNFKEYNKVFDLSEFEINETDKDLFKSHESMLSVRQLSTAIDSIDNKIDGRQVSMQKQLLQYFYFEKQKDTLFQNEPKVHDSGASGDVMATKYMKDRKINNSPISQKPPPKPQSSKYKTPKTKDELHAARQIKARSEKLLRQNQLKNAPKQKLDKPVEQYQSILETFNYKDKKTLNSKAKAFARSIHSQAASTARTVEREKSKRIEHVYEMHMKFSFAAICFIFLFVGAPMGAIVRKGGFGYPILVAIFFFMIFIVLTIMCEKLTETGVLQPIFGSWLPCLVLTPIGIFLTYKAMADSKVVNFDRYTAFFRSIFQKVGLVE